MPKILLVDDEETLLIMYKITFAKNGFTVETAYNGKEGIEKAVSFHPDVILLDIMMPVMNGLDALTILKNTPDTQHIPVIIATNLLDPVEEKKVIEAGAARYIVKSDYDPDQIIVIAKELLSSST